jgi:hypothetical protein
MLTLKAKAITVKTGTLVDATIIASASESDDDARWVKHKKRPEADVHAIERCKRGPEGRLERKPHR